MIEEKRIPTVKQIRERIEQIGDNLDPNLDPRKNRRVRKNLDLYQLKMALKYQFLTVSYSSQTAGKYRPTSQHKTQNVIEINMGKEPAAIFFIKKTRIKKLRGSEIYAPCVPLNPLYEPWTKEVVDYMEENINPFHFHDTPSSSKRILEAASKVIFKEYGWMYKEYRYDTKRIDDVIRYVNVPARKREFSNGCIPKIRVVDLISNYGFDLMDVITFGGWEDHGEGTRIPRSLKHLFQFDIHNITLDSINLLTGVAESYFKKLCKPRVDPSKIIIV